MREGALLLLACAASACSGDVWALVHASGSAPDTGAGWQDDGSWDAGVAPETDAASDAPDAFTLWTGRVEGAAFHGYAGLQVYGRIGSLSPQIASSTVEPDGSFVLQFHQALPIFESSIVYLFIDVTGDGVCNAWADYVASSSVRFFEFPDEFEIFLIPEAMRPNAIACLQFLY